jgi:Flp pilus assembly pilin Flp
MLSALSSAASAAASAVEWGDVLAAVAVALISAIF